MAAFTLQILHAGDFEGDGAGLSNAPKLAAIVDALDDAPATLVLSAGGNFGPGPFLSAGADPAAADALTQIYDGRFALPADVEGDGDADSFSALSVGAGRLEIAIMNALGVDASALGNQEFDLGTGVLADAIIPTVAGPLPGDAEWLGTEFPYLAANLDVSADAALAGTGSRAIVETASYSPSLTDLDASADVPRIAPAAIAVVDGERIGIVGAITQDLAIVSSPGDATVIAPGGGATDVAALAAMLQPTIDALLAQGVDKIILLSHLRDVDVTAALVPLLAGVDVVVAGGIDEAEPGSSPLVSSDAAGDPVLIVATAGGYSELGRLSVQFDDAGRVVVGGSEATLYPVTDATVAGLWGDAGAAYAPGTKGALVGDLVDAATDIILAKDEGLYGRTAVFLQAPAELAVRQETNLGDLATDANLARAREVDPTVAAAIGNLGGIRQSIGSLRREADGSMTPAPPAADPLTGKAEGEISQLDIESALRFNNGLTLLTLTRAQLVAALEHGLEAATDAGLTTGQFPQLSGIAVSFDPSLSPGSRIVSAALTDGGHVTDVLVRDGELVGDASAPVRIVTIAFLADGGDGYPLPGFAAADPGFTDRVDLLGEDADGDGVLNPGEDLNGNGRLDLAPEIEEGPAGFAAPGTEQDALADHLARTYAATPYDHAETDPDGDERLQNLSARVDTVLDGPYALTGRAGGDLLVGTGAADTLSGEDGDDTLDGGAAGDLLLGGDGFDQMQGGSGGDFILGGDAPDVVDGGEGDDPLLAGNEGTDLVRGGAGDDRLYGGQDGDTLDGGDGADTLSGDRGDDVLSGGDGPDRFVFSAGHGRDVILDFDAAEDRIVLTDDRAYVIADGPEGATLAWSDGQQVLVLGAAASTVSDLILFAG